MGAQRYCSKCKKTMAETNFFSYKDGTKCELCKSCLTLHVNNFDPQTYLWILEKFDVPYVESEWNVIRDKAYQKDPLKMNGLSVFGKYISKMKLRQWIDPDTGKAYGWADNEKIKEKMQADAEKFGTPREQMEEMLAAMEEAYNNGEISEAQWLTYKEMNAPEIEMQNINGMMMGGIAGIDPFGGQGVETPHLEVDLPDVGADLDDEDKVYLAMKWGTSYTAADLVALEQKYAEYEKSFDLHNADLIAGTVQLCKLDLKSNTALDSGDIDSYSKLARASDALRKSLKFTEAQRKDDKEGEFSCYGQLVAFAEKNNDEDYIRPIDLSVDRDIVDADIRNMKNYTKQLIEDDPAVFKLIEQYIKKREALAEHDADMAAAFENGDEEYQITDEDLAGYTNSLEEQRKEDLSLIFNDEEEDDE